MDEVPALALAGGKDLAEQFLGLAAIEEVILIGRALIGIAGRDGDPDVELLREIEESRDVGGRMPVEDGGVDVDGEAARLGGLDGRYRALEAAFHAHRLVVM